MTAELIPFTYEGAELRTLSIDAEPWFVAPDACRMLDLRDTTSALKMVDDEDKKTLRRSDTPHFFEGIAPQVQFLTAVNESGMWALIIQSNKDQARKVRRWLTHEVLPEIRRTGGYNTVPALPGPRELAQMVIEAEDRADREAAARIEAESHAKTLEAPAAAWSHMADSTGDYEVADAAKVLTRDPNIKIGRDRLFSFMAAEGWIYRNPATARWKAYQTQIECGRLAEKLGSPFLHHPTGEMRVPDPTIRVTPKGMAELHKRLGGSGQLALVTSA